MATFAGGGLNDSGEDGLTSIVRGAAIHHSRGQRTSLHAHYAWKLHIGIDAPVWLDAPGCSIDPGAKARVVVIPPGVPHTTGAVGWSCAVFIAPGKRSAPWRSTTTAFGLGGRTAEQLVGVCQKFETVPRANRGDFVGEVTRLAATSFVGPRRADRRVQAALSKLALEPDRQLSQLAREAKLSLDRLSRLVSIDTGMRLRRHVLWSRLLGLLSSNIQHRSIATAAQVAGFADHAHFTRTCRAFLGRAPSDFRAPPDAIESW